MRGLREKLRHAFAVDPEPGPDSALPETLERLARLAVQRRMEIPAVIFLETIRPLGFLASQAALAAWPLLKAFGGFEGFREAAQSLEDRRTLQRLIDRIEDLAHARKQAAK